MKERALLAQGEMREEGRSHGLDDLRKCKWEANVLETLPRTLSRSSERAGLSEGK